MGLGEDALDFFIQEMVAFSSMEKEDKEDDDANASKTKVPNIKSVKADKDLDSPKALAGALKERLNK